MPRADRNSLGRDLTLVMGVATAFRVVYVVLARRTPLFDYLHLDPLYYVQWGRRIAGGAWLGGKVFEKSPLYSYLLGGFFLVFGERLLLLRILQFGAGVLTCAAIYGLARMTFDARTARIAGLCAAAYGPFLYYEGQVMKSWLAYVLATLVLLSLYRSRGASPAWLGLTGLCIGILTLVRANSLVLAPALAAWALWRCGREHRRAGWIGAGSLLLGTALAVLPVGARNAAVSGEFVLLTSSAGEAFYIGNHSGANGAYLPPAFMRPNPTHEHEDFRIEAKRRTGRELSRAESSSYWLREGLRVVRADPWRWVRLELRKLALFWNARELPDNYSYAVFTRHVPVLRVCLTFGLVASLGLVGMALALRRWRELLPMYLLVAFYLLGVLLFFNFSRFRLPVVPVLLVFAAHAGVTFWDAARAGRRARAAGIGAIAIAIALLLYLPLLPTADAPGQEDSLVGYAYLDAGRAEEAAAAFLSARGQVEAYQREHGQAPGLELGSACYGLGSARLAQGLTAQAIEPLECAVALSPTEIGPLESLASALSDSGRELEGEAAQRRLIEMAPDRFAPYFALASLAYRRGQATEAQRIFHEGRARCPDMAPEELAEYHLGVAIVHLDLLNDREAALPHLREVLRHRPDHPQAAEIERQLAGGD